MGESLLQKTAGGLANSPLLRRGKILFDENSRDWNLPLSKIGKLQIGAWLILDDYSKGIFPPQFVDQQKTYQAEKEYHSSVPGMTAEQVRRDNWTKPFWPGKSGRRYISHYNHLTEVLERTGVHPPAKILELGCGGGWMAEFLAILGYDVCGTTISETDIADANKRIRSIEAKGIKPLLNFTLAPMESAHTVVGIEKFDAVFVYEALHHAFDWRETIASSFKCLKPGGWLLICNEPNVLHTCIAYRVAKLFNTHEIGFSKNSLKDAMKNAGFKQIISLSSPFHFWFRPHWLLAQK